MSVQVDIVDDQIIQVNLVEDEIIVSDFGKAVTVSNNGTKVGSTRWIDFVPGSNITLSVTKIGDKIAVEINSSGGGGSGDVVGPASATNGNIVLFDGTTGKLIKNSAYSPASFDVAGSAAAALVSANAYTDTQISALSFVSSVSGTLNRITSSGGTTPVIDISASYVGQSSITTLGTIATGVWNGTALGAAYGGTGINSSASTGSAQVAAGTWFVSTALANGTTATTQSASDNSTKVATTAYVDAATGTPSGVWLLASGGTLTGTNTITAGSNPIIFSMEVTTGTGATAGHQLVGNLLTTGNLIDVSSSSATTGNLLKITSTSAVLNHVAGTNALFTIASSGANSTSSKTAVGVQSLITNTGTTSVNIAGYFSASGATTNYGIHIASGLFIVGSSAINTTSPTQVLYSTATVDGPAFRNTSASGAASFQIGNDQAANIGNFGATGSSFVSGSIRASSMFFNATGTLTGGISFTSQGGDISFAVGGFGTADQEVYITTNGTMFGGGSGTITANTRVDIRGIGTTTNGAFRVATSGNTARFLIQDYGATYWVQGALNAGAPVGLYFEGGAHTACQASTEATDINFLLTRTVQFATGALTTQRAFRIQAPTYGFVGASTLTDAYTFYVDGAPVQGTNATITRRWAGAFGGNVAISGNTYHGALNVAPTAFVHIAAGTTSVAQIRLAAGVAPSSPNDGDVYYVDTNDRFMVRKGSLDSEIISASAVTTEVQVSDTTLTVTYNGTTYKLLVKA